VRLDYEKLSLDRNGVLRSDGDEITHQRTIDTYLKSIHRTEDGYEIRIGQESRPIQVEDTAYFVRQVELTPSGIRVQLTNGDQEILSPNSLAYGQAGRLIALIQNGQERARFLHAAYHELLNAGDLTQGRWQLKLPNIRYEFPTRTEEP